MRLPVGRKDPNAHATEIAFCENGLHGCEEVFPFAVAEVLERLRAVGNAFAIRVCGRPGSMVRVVIRHGDQARTALLRQESEIVLERRALIEVLDLVVEKDVSLVEIVREVLLRTARVNVKIVGLVKMGI